MKRFIICFFLFILCSCNRNEIYIKQNLSMDNDVYERITYPVTPYKELNRYIDELILSITNKYHDTFQSDTVYELQITFDYYEQETTLSFLGTSYFKSTNNEETNYYPFTYDYLNKTFKTLQDIGLNNNYDYYFNGTNIYYVENNELQVIPYTNEVSKTTSKVIALTFDDGPNRRITPKILDLLDEYNIKATFFLIGKQIDENQEIVERMLASGHQIGNHTFTHHNILKLSDDEILAELRKTDEALSKLNYTPTIFRPPYGSYTKECVSDISKTVITWDLDSRDWELLDANKVYKKVMSEVKNNDIILMHDMYESTYEAVKRLIPDLLEAGYEFVTVEELLEIRE
ncbi:MAG: polysaccharide deacetylase family protein [Erysipelotrichales bacterium]|nr:polysaccharide deacetylase family protein [Erysipelotrichales bacterium]